jgi:hypothetical protein
MAQFKIKQVRELQSTLDSITGIDTITEAYTTTATDGPTGITITYSCRETDNAQVYVNGVRLNRGDFGWREGTTDVSSNSELNAGAELVWDSSAIGYDIGTTDEIEIIYETGIPVTTGGSVGSGSNGADGTSGTSGTSGASGDAGTSGTSGTSGVSGDAGTSGTSGVSNSNATGLTLTSPSGIFYEVVVDDAGNLSTNNVGTSGTSGGSPSGINLTNLIAHLDASASNSYPGTGTLWTDLTGNGHNGDLTGFTTTPYSTNNGGIFEWSVDGTTGEKIVFDEAITGTQFNLATNKNQTIQAWVYVPSGFVTNLFTKGTGSTGWSSTISTSGTVSTVLYGSGAGPYNIGITGDAWNLVTLQLIESVERTNQPGTYNTGFRYYVNDTVHMNVNYPTFDYYNTNEPAGSWSNDTSSFTIGGNPVSDYDFKIGAVYVYNRILTAQEVSDNFNSTKTRFGV